MRLSSWLPTWLSGKESACQATDVLLIPRSGRFPGNEVATHSSILAWEIPWTEVWQTTAHGVTKELDKTEELNNNLKCGFHPDNTSPLLALPLNPSLTSYVTEQVI